MSFLEHLYELRRRLVNSVIIVVIAFVFCFAFSDAIFDFRSVPIRRALSEAERRELPVRGLTGEEKVLPLANLKEGDSGESIDSDAPYSRRPGRSVGGLTAPTVSPCERWWRARPRARRERVA